jgi:hypothetical protein
MVSKILATDRCIEGIPGHSEINILHPGIAFGVDSLQYDH